MAVVAVVVRYRSTPVPAPLALTLACLAVAHLAGGLVRVGDGALYNAHLASLVFRYDTWSTRPPCSGDARAVRLLRPAGWGTLRLAPSSIVVWILETVEFLTTIVNAGSQVGDYPNTAWDLVSNVAGTVAAGLYLARSVRRRA